MIADLTETSRQLFIEAFNRETEDGLDPSMMGKPLSMITYRTSTYYSPESGTDLTSEHLYVNPLHEEHIDALKYGDRRRDKDIAELRCQQAARVAATILTPDVVIGDVLLPGCAAADYRARFSDGRTKQVDTFAARPAKIVIAGGLTYASNHLERLRAADRDASPRDDMLTAILHLVNCSAGYNKRIVPEDTLAGFSLRMVPELPLNGQESIDFLRRYHGRMREELMHKVAYLEHIKSRDAISIFVQSIEEDIARFSDAKARAKQLLEEKGEEA